MMRDLHGLSSLVDHLIKITLKLYIHLGVPQKSSPQFRSLLRSVEEMIRAAIYTSASPSSLNEWSLEALTSLRGSLQALQGAVQALQGDVQEGRQGRKIGLHNRYVLATSWRKDADTLMQFLNSRTLDDRDRPKIVSWSQKCLIETARAMLLRAASEQERAKNTEECRTIWKSAIRIYVQKFDLQASLKSTYVKPLRTSLSQRKIFGKAGWDGGENHLQIRLHLPSQTPYGTAYIRNYQFAGSEIGQILPSLGPFRNALPATPDAPEMPVDVPWNEVQLKAIGIIVANLAVESIFTRSIDPSILWVILSSSLSYVAYVVDNRLKSLVNAPQLVRRIPLLLLMGAGASTIIAVLPCAEQLNLSANSGNSVQAAADTITAIAAMVDGIFCILPWPPGPAYFANIYLFSTTTSFSVVVIVSLIYLVGPAIVVTLIVVFLAFIGLLHLESRQDRERKADDFMKECKDGDWV